MARSEACPVHEMITVLDSSVRVTGADGQAETYDAGAVSDRFLIESPRYRITNGFAIGSLDRFIQMVFGRV